jgi:hypothetical protein
LAPFVFWHPLRACLCVMTLGGAFNSEIIGCDASALKAHQNGLNRMISLRGGLDKLGVVGQIARTVSVAMLVGMIIDSYMCLRETC